MVQHSTPRALTEAEIADVTEDFAHPAKNAINAGFDGVELHGANGYLNQFIDSQANNRTHGYGGSLPRRLLFLREVVEGVVAVVGEDRIGVRLAPLTTLQGAVDDTPQATYLAAARMLDERCLYIPIAEADWDDAPEMPTTFKEALRLIYRGTMIYSGKYTAERTEQAVQNGWADLIGLVAPSLPIPISRRDFNGAWR